jgi:serine O-acetyltransferase
MRNLLRAAFYSPLLLVARTSPSWPAVRRDLLRYLQPRAGEPLPPALSVAGVGSGLAHPPLRSILYARLREEGVVWRMLTAVLSRLYRGAIALEIHCPEIGPGLFSRHGFATIIIAERIGTDCLFGQQVTVGFTDRGGPPIIGDRVRISAGAIVVGPITIGDDAVIGAGAVVTRDVPPETVVAGVPARPLTNARNRFGTSATEAPS